MSESEKRRSPESREAPRDGVEIRDGLTFDDVLLEPSASEVLPDGVDVRTRLTREISLNIPLVSAAMDTVTEHETAICLAQNGGIGIVHKNMPIAAQAAEVDKVKRSESGMISDPITMRPEQRIHEALEVMARYKISGVPITLALIERLLKAYPQAVAGAKDSSGDWSNTRAMLDAFGSAGFDVFPGSEVFLLDGLRAGGKGCITATGNVNPAAIDNVYRNWRSTDADALQAGITATRKIVQSVPMIPALKATIAHYADDREWTRLRPPLVELTAAEEKKLIEGLDADGFTMPGIEAVACPVH